MIAVRDQQAASSQTRQWKGQPRACSDCASNIRRLAWRARSATGVRWRLGHSLLIIEGFDGTNGRAEVFEVIEVDPSGIEQVRYEVLYKEERQLVASMGEASVLASELAGDPRFRDPGAQWHDLRR